jgi:flagellar protein FliS
VNYASLRDRHIEGASSTASPATLLVMLYDRLVLDLLRAESALRDGKRDAAHEQLTHAQDIISELSNTLDVDAWDGAPPLMSVYTFVHTSLVDANAKGDPEAVVACRELIEPLQDAWQRALCELEMDVAEAESMLAIAHLQVTSAMPPVYLDTPA